MAQALPFITTAITAYGAVQSAKGPKLPKILRKPDDGDKKSKRNAQKIAAEKYGDSGRASTVLTGSNTLG